MADQGPCPAILAVIQRATVRLRDGKCAGQRNVLSGGTSRRMSPASAGLVIDLLPYSHYANYTTREAKGNHAVADQGGSPASLALIQRAAARLRDHKRAGKRDVLSGGASRRTSPASAGLAIILSAVRAPFHRA